MEEGSSTTTLVKPAVPSEDAQRVPSHSLVRIRQPLERRAADLGRQETVELGQRMRGLGSHLRLMHRRWVL
jgi:hypothetical protein